MAGGIHPPRAAVSTDVGEAGNGGTFARILPLGRDVPVDLVPTRALGLSGSPRLSGENTAHTRLLAESNARLPPILVHRASMRVIDGAHRVKAAAIRGQDLIEVQFFDGTEDEAFILSVRANITHGLPLSLADRHAAAERVAALHPTWSDRAVAAVTGLSPPTVSALRRKADLPDVERRRGMDGRTRPVDHVAGRRAASEIIATRPHASLREIAKAAGISPSTARDVRQRMQRGEVPQSSGGQGRASINGTFATAAPAPAAAADRRHGSRIDRAKLVESLRKDPSLRFTDTGRALLRWLMPHAAGAAGWDRVIGGIPPSSMYVLAKFARRCAEEWLEVAEQLDHRTSALS